jgi:DNA helicase-2/ATP-dependent DNA helicase PcrA
VAHRLPLRHAPDLAVLHGAGILSLLAGAELNAEQERAVRLGEGAILVLAGAGSGKTRVLTRRIEHLVREAGVPPDAILAFTFTNKAAGELKSRLAGLFDAERAPWVGTFHAVCLRILRREGARSGLAAGFTVLDREDQHRLLGRLAREREGEWRELTPGFVASRIAAAKVLLLGPAEYEESAATPRERAVAALYAAYQEQLARQGAADFDDLIGATVRLLESDSVARARWAGRFRHVLVDEFQDTNHAQFRLIAGLASQHGNLMAVGDEDQSIYAWRGADLSNVLQFERSFPSATLVRLEQNYRSTPQILEAAGAVIAHNRRRRGKRLWTARPDGERLTLLLSGDEHAEAARLAAEARRHAERGGRLSEFAVLYRTNAQSRALELAFRQLGVPYELVGGLSFYERREVKDLLAYLRLVVNARDFEAFLRIANVPRRGFGERAVAAVAARREAGEAVVARALEAALGAGEVPGPGRRGGQLLLALLGDLAARRAEGPEPLLRQVLERTGYLEHLDETSPGPMRERRENVEELLTAAAEFRALRPEGSVEDFLAEAALATDLDAWSEAPERAVLMTLHNAKGLEFSTVVVAGCEEGLVPHASALGDEAELEEERRLFYVGLTRARERAIVSAVGFRRRFDGGGTGELSRFVREIPAALLQVESGAASAPALLPGASGPEAARGEHAGRIVYHETFGRGVVLGADGAGPAQKFTVRFAGAGVKRVLGRFLTADD